MCSAVMMFLLPVVGDVDVGIRERVLKRENLIALHRGLQSADRIDLGDDDASALARGATGSSPCPRRHSRRRRATLPLIITSVARNKPSIMEWRQPYRLSEFALGDAYR